MSTFALDRVSAHLPEAVVERYVDRAGGAWAVIHPQHLPRVVAYLKSDPELNFKLFVSIDAVDRLHLAENDPRFEIVYFLYSLSRNEHVRLKVRVTESNPEVPSLVPLFKGANWWERLTYDFYGIKFVGHPDLRRILMYEEFQGYPLRKDYALRDRQPLIPERPIKDIFRGPGTSGLS